MLERVKKKKKKKTNLDLDLKLNTQKRMQFLVFQLNLLLLQNRTENVLFV